MTGRTPTQRTLPACDQASWLSGLLVGTAITLPMPLFTWQVVSPLMDCTCQPAAAPTKGGAP